MEKIDLFADFWENVFIRKHKTVGIVIIAILFLAILSPSADEAKVSRVSGLSAKETIGRKAEEGQIKVFSKYPHIKSKFDVYSREIRTQFRNLLGLYDSDEWKIPLKIHLYGTGNDVHSGNDIITKIVQYESNPFALQLQVKVHNRFREETYRLAFVRALILEQMLDGFAENPDAFQAGELVAPDWLVYGFDQILRHRELGKPSYFYSGFAKSGQLLKISEIVKPNQTKGLNPMSLELFRASSSILVAMLCEQKDGGESIRGLLGDLSKEPSTNAEILIRKNFPGLRATGKGIEKWWALQLATLSQKQSFEYFSPEETEEHLVKNLELYFPAGKVAANPKKSRFFNRMRKKAGKEEMIEVPEYRGTLADFETYLSRPDAKQVLANRYSSLVGLKLRAFPLYQQVIDRYLVVCESLLANKTRNVKEELAELESMRLKIGDSMAKTRDYLNYYEATRAPKKSDAFDNFLKFKEEMKSGSVLPKRSDAISEFIDEFERQSRWKN